MESDYWYNHCVMADKRANKWRRICGQLTENNLIALGEIKFWQKMYDDELRDYCKVRTALKKTTKRLQTISYVALIFLGGFIVMCWIAIH